MTQIKGLDDLQRKLKTLENFQRKMKKPMEESAILVHNYIARQFPKKAGAFSAMAKPGQKRAYWARVRAGEITHLEGSGYRRSGGMKAWTKKVKMNSDGVKAEIGNKAWSGTWRNIYVGEFIQGKHQQKWLAASGIRTTVETLDKLDDKIQGKFEKVIKRELNR